MFGFINTAANKTFKGIRAENLEERDMVFPETGIIRALKLGTAVPYITLNLATYFLGTPNTSTWIPTGLGTTKLVFVTFLLTMFYFTFKPMWIDQCEDNGKIYDPEKHGEITKQYSWIE